MSEFVPEDPEVTAWQEQVHEAWQADPSQTAIAIATEAAAQEQARLQPAIDEVLNAHRTKLQQDAADEAVAAMDTAYGVGWREQYGPAVTEFFEKHPDLIPVDKLHDAQFVAEATQAAYRAVKPVVDSKSDEQLFADVKGSYQTYADVMARSGR